MKKELLCKECGGRCCAHAPFHIRKMKAIEKSMAQKTEELKRERAEKFAKLWSFGGEKV